VAGANPAGGSLQLVKLIEDGHGEAILSDLSQYHGRDLRDLWRDNRDLTPRYVLWLVGHLPEDSAFIASMRGGQQHRVWTLQNHLLASVANLLFAANRQRAGLKTHSMPVKPPTPKTAKRQRRVIPIGRLPGVRRIAGR
jgi:hypothetical protein